MAIKESITYVMDLVDKYTGPAQKVMSSVNKMDENFLELNKQRERAGTIKSDLKNFDSLNLKLNANSESLTDTRNEAKKLGKEIANTENPTKKQITAFNKAKSSVSRLERSQTKYRQGISSMNTQLTKAGVNTTNMALAHRKADAEVKKLTKSLDKELKALTEISMQQAKIDKWSNKAKHIRGSVTAGDVVAAGGGLYAIKKLAQEYGEISTAQGELGSLGMNDVDIQTITNKARMFSNEFAGFQQAQLISASYDLKSGMSNLSGDALAGYLEISAQVAGGTKASIDQITGLMATGYGIYRDGFGNFAKQNIKGWEKLSADEKDIKFGEYFGAGIAAAVQKFKTDGSEMTQAIQKIGKVAETSNVPMAEQLAILGMLQTTMSGSEAATKYKSFLNKAVLAGDKLGLSLTDQNNQLLSTVGIIGKLKSKYGETLDDMEKADLKKAFGSDEAMAYITLMYAKTDDLKNSTNGLSDSMTRGRDVYGEMANSIMRGGPLESIQLMSQATKNAMADLGYGFAPIIATVAGVIGSASNTFGNFLRENGDLAEYIALAATALIAFKIVAVTSKFVFGGLFDLFALGNKALLFWRTATMGAAAGTGILAQAQMVLNAAFAANPIGLAIAAVVALGAAGYMLYKHWDSIVIWISEAWNGMVDNFIAGGAWVVDAIGSYFKNLLAIIMYPIQVVKDAFSWVSDFWEGDEGQKSIEITKRIKSEFQSPVIQNGDGQAVPFPQSPVIQNGDGQAVPASYSSNKSQIVKGGSVTSNKNQSDVTIQSNDTYQITVPETSDPEMVRRVLREELDVARRKQARQVNQVMYDY